MPSREEVLETARLARLALMTDEVERMRHELDGILRHIEAIRQVAAATDRAGSAAEHAVAGTDAVNAAENVSVAAVDSPPLRPDLPGSDSLDMPPSSFAPEWREGFFTVARLPIHD